MSIGGTLRQGTKRVLIGIALALVSPAAFTAWVERRMSRHGDVAFVFWAHVFALMPGLPGMYLRRAYYCLTLDRCATDFFIGFGALFTRRSSEVQTGAYIGPYSLIGSVRLGRHCLIGSRVSLVSGKNLHAPLPGGGWGPTDPDRFEQVEIGERAWIGEGAIVLASVGPGAMIAAGSVVTADVPIDVMVAGNPARFVKVLQSSSNTRATRVVAGEESGSAAAGLRAVD
jgi:virginiamycin A acetyltransferase